jgi:hypothetical protein
MLSSKLAHPRTSSSLSLAQHVPADHAARLADTDLRRDVDDVGMLEAGRRFADELEYLPRLPPAFDFAVAHLLDVEAAHRRSVRIADERRIGRPLDGILLCAYDRAAARKLAPLRFGFFHQLRNEIARASGALRIDVVDAELGRRIEEVARTVAELVRRAGPRRDVAVAGAVDEHAAAHGGTARLAFDEERIDRALRFHREAHDKGMEKDLHARADEELVGRHLVCRHVVGLRHDLAVQRQVRRIDGIHFLQPLDHLIGDAVNDLAMLAMDIGVQAAEIRKARGRASPAEKTVALDQQRRMAAARRGRGSRDAGRTAAGDHHVELAQHARMPRPFRYFPHAVIVGARC